MAFEHIEEKEAVKMAALIEENGIRFYTLMAEKTDDEKARATFRMLAEDEGKHRRVIESEHFPEAGFTDQITDEEIEIEEYVKRLGVPDIFTKKIDIDRLVAAIDSPKKALLIALDTERHAVEFFEAMSRRASTDEAGKIYAELAAEEREHQRHIAELLKEYE